MKKLIGMMISLLFICFAPVYADDETAVCPSTFDINNLTLVKAYSLINNWWFVDASKFLSRGYDWKAIFSIGFDVDKTPEDALRDARYEILHTVFLPGIGYSSQGITVCVFLNISKDKNYVVAISPAIFKDKQMLALKNAIKEVTNS